MNNATIVSASHQVDTVPRQSKNMAETTNIALDTDLEFLSLKEFASVLRVAPISIYRLVAKQALPVYRMCRKILFKKSDVVTYLEHHKKNSGYGSSKT